MGREGEGEKGKGGGKVTLKRGKGEGVRRKRIRRMEINRQGVKSLRVKGEKRKVVKEERRKM